jgi:hypothetical protein
MDKVQYFDPRYDDPSILSATDGRYSSVFDKSSTYELLQERNFGAPPAPQQTPGTSRMAGPAGIAGSVGQLAQAAATAQGNWIHGFTSILGAGLNFATNQRNAGIQERRNEISTNQFEFQKEAFSQQFGLSEKYYRLNELSFQKDWEAANRAGLLHPAQFGGIQAGSAFLTARNGPTRNVAQRASGNSPYAIPF